MLGKRRRASDKIPSVVLLGTVEKIIPSTDATQIEKAQIVLKGAEDLYKEIRIDNILDDEDNKVGLKLGAGVKIIILAEKRSTIPRTPLRIASFSYPQNVKAEASSIQAPTSSDLGGNTA